MSFIDRLKSYRRDDGGQALVEFALIMPFLLLFLIGIVEFGRGWNQHQVITDAAREAARSSVLFDVAITTDSVRKIAQGALAASGINPANATITITDEGSGGASVVAITLPYRLVFFGALKQWTTGESTVQLRTSFTMRNE
jgi:Flp pilus assembly protein TadG